MMYQHGEAFLSDFINRTKENYLKLQNDKYEVTQLINSSVGLLIIPEQLRFRKLKDEMISPELLKEVRACIVKDTYVEDQPIPSLQSIAKHMRNAVAHNKLSFDNDSETNEIKMIYFADKRTKEQFELRMSVDLLRRFFFEFSDATKQLR